MPNVALERLAQVTTNRGRSRRVRSKRLLDGGSGSQIPSAALAMNKSKGDYAVSFDLEYYIALLPLIILPIGGPIWQIL